MIEFNIFKILKFKILLGNYYIIICYVYFKNLFLFEILMLYIKI